MSDERWIKRLEMLEKIKQAVNAKEKTRAEEQEIIMQEAERRAWLRTLQRTDSDGSCTLSTDKRGKNGL